MTGLEIAQVAVIIGKFGIHAVKELSETWGDREFTVDELEQMLADSPSPAEYFEEQRTGEWNFHDVDEDEL